VTARISGLGLRQHPLIGRLGAVVFLSLSIVVFGLYSPLAYGNPWTQSACKQVKLFELWDWDCNTFHTDLSQYATGSPAANSNAVSTGAPVVPSQAEKPAVIEKPKDQQQQVLSEAPKFTPIPLGAGGQQILSREEKVEYRDQDGNLLNEEQIAALSGKVSFKTRYETRTRVVDAAGNEILNEVVNVEEDVDREANKANNAGVAPPHPDASGETQESNMPERDVPATQLDVEEDEVKEGSVEKSNTGTPRPGSEANDATK